MSEEIKNEEGRALTEEELNTWNEMYEKCKEELPKGVYQNMQKYCITTAFLATCDIRQDRRGTGGFEGGHQQAHQRPETPRAHGDSLCAGKYSFDDS